MPADFLSDAQVAAYGQFTAVPSRSELERFFFLDGRGLELIAGRRGDHSRLGLAVQIGTVRYLGRFLEDPLDVPWPVVEYLAGQLGIADASCVKAYTDRPKTAYEHAWEILGRKIFHGRRGQIYQAYREGQEDQFGALGLVLNAVVLWNTVYLDAALARLREQGHPDRDEDVARLSPLGHAHLNVLGRYTFTTSVPTAGLRPLRDPDPAGDAGEA